MSDTKLSEEYRMDQSGKPVENQELYSLSPNSDYSVRNSLNSQLFFHYCATAPYAHAVLLADD